MGSNPVTVYLTDVNKDASCYTKEKLEINVAKWGTPKNDKNVKNEYCYHSANVICIPWSQMDHIKYKIA